MRARLALLLCAGVLAACQSQQILSQENDLEAAGFTVRIANTAERQAMLNRLPANRFVQRGNGSDIRYIYADPQACAAWFG